MARSASFLDGVVAGMFTAPGDGDLDFAPVMRALVGVGYDGSPESVHALRTLRLEQRMQAVAAWGMPV